MDTARIKAILDFWFGKVSTDSSVVTEKKKLWWGKNAQLDHYIRIHFEKDLQKLQAGRYAEWLNEPSGRIAAIVVLDQFSRNIYRNQADAFRQDELALQYAQEGLALQHDQMLPFFEKAFFYLPFEHSEALADQERAIELFKKLYNEAPAELKNEAQQLLDFAVRHWEIIKRFDRFPHRNSILKRQSTEEELAFLKEPGAHF